MTGYMYSDEDISEIASVRSLVWLPPYGAYFLRENKGEKCISRVMKVLRLIIFSMK